MGMIGQVIDRADSLVWRARHWWFDTRGGGAAKVVLWCMAVLVVVLQLIHLSVTALLQPHPTEPVKSVYWWVVQLIIAVVAAVVSYAMRPKPEQAKATQGQSPRTKDGQAAKDIWGTRWIEDDFWLAWKVVGFDKIRSKGGKK